jgi:hypothetical protein
MKIQSLPFKLQRVVFSVFSDELRRQVKERGLSEGEILEDFKSWRKHRLKPVPPAEHC